MRPLQVSIFFFSPQISSFLFSMTRSHLISFASFRLDSPKTCTGHRFAVDLFGAALGESLLYLNDGLNANSKWRYIHHHALSYRRKKHRDSSGFLGTCPAARQIIRTRSGASPVFFRMRVGVGMRMYE